MPSNQRRYIQLHPAQKEAYHYNINVADDTSDDTIIDTQIKDIARITDYSEPDIFELWREVSIIFQFTVNTNIRQAGGDRRQSAMNTYY